MATKPQTPATPATQPAAPATQPAAPVAVKVNARQHLRTLFGKVGDVHTRDEVYGIKRDTTAKVKEGEELPIVATEYKAVTINTHLTDLKNVNYCGKQGTMSIVKMTDGTFKRVA